MAKLNPWMRFALKKCDKSTHKKFKMVAVLIKGGSVLSWAANRQDWGAHAELRCIVRAKIPEGATLYVVRRLGRTSKPCPDCQYLIKKSKIKKVVYFDLEGKEETYSP
jgi:tRNA(Arg) A34 adenosine deaminase TadA